jgi:hypothetical protein
VCNKFGHQSETRYSHSFTWKYCDGFSQSIKLCSQKTPLLGNGPVKAFLLKMTKIGNLFLSNCAVNKSHQKYKLCFPFGPCKVVIREANSEAKSSWENWPVAFESIRIRMEHVLVNCEVGRLAKALELIVIVKKWQQIQSSNPEPVIIRHGTTNTWQYGM